jgi:hypothetical protein
MRDEGTAAASEGGGVKPSLLVYPSPTDREDAAENPMKPPVRNGSVDRGVAQPDRS